MKNNEKLCYTNFIICFEKSKECYLSDNSYYILDKGKETNYYVILAAEPPYYDRVWHLEVKVEME